MTGIGTKPCGRAYSPNSAKSLASSLILKGGEVIAASCAVAPKGILSLLSPGGYMPKSSDNALCFVREKDELWTYSSPGVY